MNLIQDLLKYDDKKFHHANEAQTRIDVISRILYEVLGWKHDDIRVEHRVSENGKVTFADFVVSTATYSFVVEAKKIGKSFQNLPLERTTKIRKLSRNGALAAPIRQARDYARGLGIGFAVLTNGSQWIIFPASRTDQVSFDNSLAIVFSSLRSILEKDHDEFRELLAREAVISGSLESALLGRIETKTDERRLNRYYSGTIRPARTNLFPLIQTAIDTVLTDDFISGDSELLEKCYVSTRDSIRFDSRIQMHISKRQPIAETRPLRPMKSREQRALSEVIESATNVARPVAVLILGLVGAGKTTFLNYTRNVSSKELFVASDTRPYPHWLYVDFRAYSPQTAAYDYICQTLKDRIRADKFLSDGNRCLQHAYKNEIDGLSRGPLFLLGGDSNELNRRVSELLMRDYELTGPYVEKVLAYAARSSAVFLVIDNVDQVSAEETQTRIFADAMALAQRIKCHLILSMRDATYLKNKSAAVFDAFDFDSIYIDAPKLNSVLSKRFLLASAKLRDVQGDFFDPTLGQVHVHDLSVIIDLIQTSVLGTEIGTLIDVFSASDVRVALRMTREFLQNGYTATARALQIFQTEGRYTMPRHDAIRAIILGSRGIYSEEHSMVGNPFDARLARNEAQLLRLYVLAALVACASDRSFQHLEGSEIARCLASIGFNESICARILADLCELRFVQTVGQVVPSIEASYNPTRLGGYIVRHLIGDFTFVHHIMVDTNITSDQTWIKMRGFMDTIVPEKDVVARIEARAKCVVEFYNK